MKKREAVKLDDKWDCTKKVPSVLRVREKCRMREFWICWLWFGLGFGDAINCENSWRACTEYIDEQFQQYFLAESGVNRKHIQDTRVHCCLYFVPPYGHGLRPLDIEALKCLQTRVNLIPIIAKADILTPAEVKKLKDQILEDLRTHQIQVRTHWNIKRTKFQ